MASKNPLTVEVTRGDMVESRHRGHAVVIDAEGGIVHAWGDAEMVIYPRSAIKPLQAMALVETGAAEAFHVTAPELALASASHGATPAHTDAVRAWLARIGLGPNDLECGAHVPMDHVAARALVIEGRAPNTIDNNCSGKHTGMLATALHMGEATAGYTEPTHPVQKGLRALLTEMGGADLAAAPDGTDGCGIPVFGMQLRAVGRALARMADRGGLGPERAKAAWHVVDAMTAHPILVAGPGRFDTIAMTAAPGRFAVKTGAEGVHGAIVPGLGLGVVLKIEDGARRAAETAMAAILGKLGLFDGLDADRRGGLTEKAVTNAAGKAVGVVRMAPDWDS